MLEAGVNVVGIELPDVAVRILGIVDLIALLFLAYSTVKIKEGLRVNFQFYEEFRIINYGENTYV